MPPDTGDTLIKAATHLLDEGGVEAVTLREVGRLAGVSHNAPYKHFASKEALLATVAARELAELAAMQARVSAGVDPAQAVRLVLDGYIAWALARPARFKLVFSAWTIDSAELAT